MGVDPHGDAQPPPSPRQANNQPRSPSLERAQNKSLMAARAGPLGPTGQATSAKEAGKGVSEKGALGTLHDTPVRSGQERVFLMLPSCSPPILRRCPNLRCFQGRTGPAQGTHRHLAESGSAGRPLDIRGALIYNRCESSSDKVTSYLDHRSILTSDSVLPAWRTMGGPA